MPSTVSRSTHRSAPALLGLLALLTLPVAPALGCRGAEPPARPPVAAPTPAPAPPLPPPVEWDREQREGGLRLRARSLEEEGWRGRMIVASTEASPARIRVVPSSAVRSLSDVLALAPELDPESGPPLVRPMVAVNGAFYDRQREAMGVVIAGGSAHRPLTEDGGSGVLVIGERTVRIVAREDFANEAPPRDALQSIDRLVVDGENVVVRREGMRRAARVAVALDAEGEVHLVLAFDAQAIEQESEERMRLGARVTDTGPTFWEMAELLRRSPREGGVGARYALGLDGGSSIAMVAKIGERPLSIRGPGATINAVALTGTPTAAEETTAEDAAAEETTAEETTAEETTAEETTAEDATADPAPPEGPARRP